MNARRQSRSRPDAWAWLVVGLLCAASVASAAPADEKAIAKLIEQLGANDYKVRQQAQKDLVKIGRPAIPQLEQALKSADAEVQQRAEKALADIRKGSFGRASEAIARQIIWKIETSGTLARPPARSGDRLVTLSQAGVLRALEAANGAEAWKVKANPAYAPAVAGPTVYYVGAAGRLEAIGVKSGKALAGFAGPKAKGVPVVAGGVVYVVADSKKLLALDAKTGGKKWEGELSEKVTSPAAPVVGGGRVFVPVGQGGVAAYDGKTGKRIWQAMAIKGQVDCLAYSGGVLVGRSQAGLRGFDPAEGTVLWEYTAPVSNAAGVVVFQAQQVINVNGQKIVISNSSDRARRSMAIADGVVYVAAGDRLTAVDLKKGKQKWAHKTAAAKDANEDAAGGAVIVQGGGAAQIRMILSGAMGGGPGALTAPAVAGGVAYYGGDGLHALDLKTKQELWRLKTDNPVVGAPVVIDGVLYFITAPGMGGMGGPMVIRGGQPAIQSGAKLHALRLKLK